MVYNKYRIMKHDYNNYVLVHSWLRRFEKNGRCEHCSSTDKKRYEWALIKGCAYEKRRENFIELCVSCHRQYDGLMEALAVRKLTPVVAISDNNRIKFESIKEATQLLDVLPSSVSNCLKGRSKTAKGYRWEYA